MKTSKFGVAALTVGLLLVLSSAVMAQDQQPQNRQRGRGGPPGQPGGRGTFDPNQFRDQMFNRIREQLAVSDDEWKVLAPKVDHAYTAQRESRSSTRTSTSSRDRGGDPTRTDPNQTPLSKAIADLQAAVADKAPTEELMRRVGLVRELRDKARADYSTAQKDLKELLTARQEAILVSTGILE
jgi:hypothetical protein